MLLGNIFPLTSDSFRDLIKGNEGDCFCLGMNLEQFGEEAKQKLGFFKFLEEFPQTLIEAGFRFLTASDLLTDQVPHSSLDVPRSVSWTGDSQNHDAWMGNSRQLEALRKIYEMETIVKESGKEGLLQTWSYLQCSDHFRFMRELADEENTIPDKRNPFGSPQKAYAHFMNLVADFQLSLSEL